MVRFLLAATLVVSTTLAVQHVSAPDAQAGGFRDRARRFARRVKADRLLRRAGWHDMKSHPACTFGSNTITIGDAELTIPGARDVLIALRNDALAHAEQAPVRVEQIGYSSPPHTAASLGTEGVSLEVPQKLAYSIRLRTQPQLIAQGTPSKERLTSAAAASDGTHIAIQTRTTHDVDGDVVVVYRVDYIERAQKSTGAGHGGAPKHELKERGASAIQWHNGVNWQTAGTFETVRNKDGTMTLTDTTIESPSGDRDLPPRSMKHSERAP